MAFSNFQSFYEILSENIFETIPTNIFSLLFSIFAENENRKWQTKHHLTFLHQENTQNPSLSSTPTKRPSNSIASSSFRHQRRT